MIINRKKIWELSWPIILANFSIPLVGLVDTLIMGHMPSSDFLAAVALGGIIFNFMYAGLNFLRMGTTGIIAQYHGQKNTEEIFLGLLRPIIIAIIIGITNYAERHWGNKLVGTLYPNTARNYAFHKSLATNSLWTAYDCFAFSFCFFSCNR